MSDAINPEVPADEEPPPSFDIASPDLAAFAFVMDTVAGEADDSAAGETGGAVPTAGAGVETLPVAGEGIAPAAGATAQPTAGDAAGGIAPDAEESPWRGTVDAAALASDWAKVREGVEARTVETFRTEVFEEVKTEYAKYIEAINEHPRNLVGLDVPSLREGVETERLRDSSDAKDWQDAVKQALANEMNDRVSRRVDASAGDIARTHEVIELFEKNPELTPGTKQFDVELARRFGTLAQPYMQKNEAGKVVGFTIPVAPMLASVKAQLVAERTQATAAAAAAPATPSPQAARAADQARNPQGQFAAPPASGPQAGIQSSAGSSDAGGEDFSTLFGTIGLPTLRI